MKTTMHNPSTFRHSRTMYRSRSISSAFLCSGRPTSPGQSPGLPQGSGMDLRAEEQDRPPDGDEQVGQPHGQDFGDSPTVAQALAGDDEDVIPQGETDGDGEAEAAPATSNPATQRDAQNAEKHAGERNGQLLVEFDDGGMVVLALSAQRCRPLAQLAQREFLLTQRSLDWL